MTLAEIEATVTTLKERHRGLDQGMLRTLLSAGGWEEKDIADASLVLSSQLTSGEINLPTLSSSPAFVAPADIDHRLLSHNAITETRVVENSSLVVAHEVSPAHRDDLPHDLPLRPFETSEHIWPFSRYRDVFYGEGDTMETTTNHITNNNVYVAPQVTMNVNHEAAPVAAPEKVHEKIVERVVEKIVEKPVYIPQPVTQVHIAKAPLSGGDEKLVILACVMLLAILMLLGYMYSNGRL